VIADTDCIAATQSSKLRQAHHWRLSTYMHPHPSPGRLLLAGVHDGPVAVSNGHGSLLPAEARHSGCPHRAGGVRGGLDLPAGGGGRPGVPPGGPQGTRGGLLTLSVVTLQQGCWGSHFCRHRWVIWAGSAVACGQDSTVVRCATSWEQLRSQMQLVAAQHPFSVGHFK
jgi:hypothetical protein